MTYASIVIYLFKSSLAFTLLYSLYRVLLKKETFHSLNRVVLILIMQISIAFPFFEFKTDNPNALTKAVATLETEVDKSGEYSILVNRYQENLAQWESAGITPIQATYHVDRQRLNLSLIIKWGVIVYLVVALFLLGRYVFQLLSLFRLLRSSKSVPMDIVDDSVGYDSVGYDSVGYEPVGSEKGVRLEKGMAQSKGLRKRGLRIKTLFNENLSTSCSWMRWIVMNIPQQDKNFEMVHAHERSHVRLGHSWDMLLCQLFTRLLWFLPMAWQLRRDLRDVHEYQADACVLKADYDAEAYQLLLIRSASSPKAMVAANSFNSSAVKGRLKMMFRNPSSIFARTKILYLLPLFALTATLVAKPTLLYDAEMVVVGAFSVNPTPRHELNNKTVDVHLIETARITLEEFLAMPCKYDIDPQKYRTVITLYRFISSKDEIIAFNREAYTIYDEDTGDRYMCREIDGYGDEVNINLKNYSSSVVPFTLVFPPLKKDVTTIRLLSGDKTVSEKPFKIDDIRHKSYRIIR